MGQHSISAGDSHKQCLVKIGVPYACICSSSIVSLVLSPLRRPPLAVLLWRMSRGDAFRGALVWRFLLVGHACARMWWVGVLSVLSSVPLSFCSFFLFFFFSFSFSLPQPVSSLNPPFNAVVCLERTSFLDAEPESGTLGYML